MTHTQSTLMKLAAVIAYAHSEAFGEIRTPEARMEKGDRIVVSIPDKKLVLLQGDRILKVYPVAVGKPSTPTPRGEFKIINQIPNPTYYGPKVVIAPGKDNPLGTRWMGLSAKGYGIHGTNVPSSIGKAASHGCVRMRQTDLEELFTLVSVGTTVDLRGDWPQLLAQVFAQGQETPAQID